MSGLCWPAGEGGSSAAGVTLAPDIAALRVRGSRRAARSPLPLPEVRRSVTTDHTPAAGRGLGLVGTVTAPLAGAARAERGRRERPDLASVTRRWGRHPVVSSL